MTGGFSIFTAHENALTESKTPFILLVVVVVAVVVVFVAAVVVIVVVVVVAAVVVIVVLNTRRQKHSRCFCEQHSREIGPLLAAHKLVLFK